MARRGVTFEPTPEERFLVQTLSSHGISHGVIANVVRRSSGGITVKTLYKYFREDLNGGRETVKATLIAALIRAGISGNVNAIKYWMCLFGGPEWKVQPVSDDPSLPLGSSQPGTTTIVIHGGLPATVYHQPQIGADEEEEEQSNGHDRGNGASLPS